MIKKIFVSLALFSSLAVIGQEVKNVTYKIHSNDTTPKSNYGASINYGVSLDNPAMLGYDIQANALFQKSFINVDLEKNLGMLADSKAKDSVSTIYRKIEIEAGLALTSKVKEINEKVSYTSGGKTWKVAVPIKQFSVKGIHLGIQNRASYLTNTKYDKLKPATGDHYYDYNLNRLFVGYFWSSQRDYEFSVDGRYFRGMRYAVSYIDLIYASPDLPELLKSQYNLRSVGARLGVKFYSLRTLGLSFKTELGMLPKHFKSSGDISVFVQMGVGIHLGYSKMAKSKE